MLILGQLRMNLPSQMGYKCMPIALLEGTTAPLMMLLPYSNDPATGSRIPSMSTGGAAMKAVMKQVMAANSVGNMMVPNQPMYRRFSVLVIQFANCSQTAALSFLLAVMLSGEREAAFILVKKSVPVVSVLKSFGTKDKEDEDARVRGEATVGTVKASEPEARRATTMESENFMFVCT